MRRRTQAALSQSSIVSGWSWQFHLVKTTSTLRQANAAIAAA